MPLWAATALFIVCAGAAIIFIKQYRKSKKSHIIFLTVIVSMLALALLAYVGLTFILLGGVGDAPPHIEITTDNQ